MRIDKSLSVFKIAENIVHTWIIHLTDTIEPGISVDSQLSMGNIINKYRIIFWTCGTTESVFHYNNEI